MVDYYSEMTFNGNKVYTVTDLTQKMYGNMGVRINNYPAHLLKNFLL